MEDVIVKYIGNVGLPGLMCFYFMFAVNKSLTKLTEAVNNLKDHSEQLTRIENKIDMMHYSKKVQVKGENSDEC